MSTNFPPVTGENILLLVQNYKIFLRKFNTELIYNFQALFFHPDGLIYLSNVDKTLNDFANGNAADVSATKRRPKSDRKMFTGTCIFTLSVICGEKLL